MRHAHAMPRRTRGARPPRLLRAASGLLAAGLLTACGGDVSTAPSETPRRELTPACTNPAPLHGTPSPQLGPRYIVLFRPGVEPTAEVARLARVHRFTPTHVYLATGGFAAELTPSAVAGLRCEGSVMLLEYDQVVTIAGAPW
jgi:hypothetical protein